MVTGIDLLEKEQKLLLMFLFESCKTTVVVHLGNAQVVQGLLQVELGVLQVQLEVLLLRAVRIFCLSQADDTSKEHLHQAFVLAGRHCIQLRSEQVIRGVVALGELCACIVDLGVDVLQLLLQRLNALLQIQELLFVLLAKHIFLIERASSNAATRRSRCTLPLNLQMAALGIAVVQLSRKALSPLGLIANHLALLVLLDPHLHLLTDPRLHPPCAGKHPTLAAPAAAVGGG
mmetsp:Transcript_46545/g.75966  ORF Transcript_46545/g.75966 Transcript_46545/m.75966 type:complete len:232 (-) Transcript_46545:2855-3550(-)